MPATAAPATYTLTIAGKSCSNVSHSTTVKLVVNPVGDFTFTGTSALTVKRGSSGLAYVYLAGRGGFYCSAGLKAGTLPTGVTA